MSEQNPYELTTKKNIGVGSGSTYLPQHMTQEKAMYLLQTIWPKAPEEEVIKAAMLCQQYSLSPLMRQVYLIPFKDKWVTVLGIKASRQIAQQALRRQGLKYSYASGPRIMTDDEQIAIRGKVQPDKICAITILKDSEGNEFPGYGYWPRDESPYGIDKGNDGFNMAFIRSERNALDKLAPGELPDIEVGDDNYIAGDYKVAIEKGKQELSQEAEKDSRGLWPPDVETSEVRLDEVRQRIIDLAISKDKVRATTDYMAENYRVSKTKDLTLMQAKGLLEALENDII